MSRERTPENIVIAPKKEEARSKRVNLLIQPSLHNLVQKKCEKTGVSINECINQLLEMWIQQ